MVKAVQTTISCIIPSLRRGEVLCETIRMLLEQSIRPHEIIVVDQSGSHTKPVQQKLQTWVEKKRISWIQQSEPNASKARNAGALIATGEILLFLDDAIRIAPDFLSQYEQTFARTGAVGVAGSVLEGESEFSNCLEPKALDEPLGWLLNFPKNYGHECETSFMMSGNVAIRRELFLSLGGMDENYEKGAHREESDFAMRLRRAGYHLRYNPKCQVYHLGPSSVPGGGARNWQGKYGFGYFHHCIGDWYFSFGFWTVKTAPQLLASSVRHFVLNRRNVERPWRLPLALGYWLAGLPFAVARRTFGPRLLQRNAAASGTAFTTSQ